MGENASVGSFVRNAAGDYVRTVLWIECVWLCSGKAMLIMWLVEFVRENIICILLSSFLMNFNTCCVVLIRLICL